MSRFSHSIIEVKVRTPSYNDRVQELASISKSMAVELSELGVAVAVLGVLPQSYRSIFTTLDALSWDSATFTLNLVEIRRLQEEQRQEQIQREENLETLLYSSRQRAPFRRGNSLSQCIFVAAKAIRRRCSTIKTPH